MRNAYVERYKPKNIIYNKWWHLPNKVKLDKMDSLYEKKL